MTQVRNTSKYNQTHIKAHFTSHHTLTAHCELVCLISMFNSMNKIYKNLFAIAISAYLSLHNDFDQQDANLLNTAEVQVQAPVSVQQEAPVQVEVENFGGESRYDFLDFDEEVDGTAGYADDLNYGARQGGDHYAHRQTVTMDVTKSGYRSMAVNMFDHSESVTASVSTTGAKIETHFESSTAVRIHSVNVGAKQDPAGTLLALNNLYTTLVGATASIEGSPADNHHFTDLLAQRSQEELSRILHLSLACICYQLPGSVGCEVVNAATAKSSLKVPAYLATVMRHNHEFVQTIHDLVTQDGLRHAAEGGHSYDRFNSKEIAQCAKQLEANLL